MNPRYGMILAILFLASWVSASADAACADNATPVRDGRPITSEHPVLGRATIAAVLFAQGSVGGVDSDGKPIAEIDLSGPSVWCPDDDDATAHLWHSDPASDGGRPADRVTLGTATKVVLARSDPTSLIFPDRKTEPPLWLVTAEDGNALILLGLFDGRPPSAALKQLATDWEAGHATPLLKVGLTSGVVTILRNPR